MPREQSDVSYLWDMLEYSRSVREMVQGRTYEEYLRDRQFRWAVERCIELIGESARNVSRACQDSQPHIPWQKIVAQRHVLAHEYGEIKHERIWVVATAHVPALIAQLEPLVPPPPPPPESEH
jgi:uncharacterized protein with HEPN domain